MTVRGPAASRRSSSRTWEHSVIWSCSARATSATSTSTRKPQLADGAVKFWLAAPGPGRYRMFFDFQVAGQVHTAAFTVVVES